MKNLNTGEQQSKQSMIIKYLKNYIRYKLKLEYYRQREN